VPEDKRKNQGGGSGLQNQPKKTNNRLAITNLNVSPYNQAQKIFVFEKIVRQLSE
jgi:hypothetical protein